MNPGYPAVTALACLVSVALLAGCQNGRSAAGAPSAGKSAALSTMERLAIAAHRCWFASKDPAFAPYRMADELNSFSGRPRFLLVPALTPEARPLLVVQAEGARPDMQVFGPLMDEPLGQRIAADIRRWNAGSSSCSASA